MATGAVPYLLGFTPSSSSDVVGNLLLPQQRSGTISGTWVCRPWRRRAGPVAALANGRRDHYSVLGVPRSASQAELKRAYRLLARKYHPDVSKESQAGEAFKSIRAAYEILSNDITRAQYDRQLKFEETAGRSYQKIWLSDSELHDRRTIYRWAEQRYKMQNEKRKKTYRDDETTSAFDGSHFERAPFDEVLLSSILTLFFLQTIGSHLTLAFCNLNALLDSQLDAGYKMGYALAWFLGGQGGVLLTICISFTSWLCGKNSSGLVSLVVLAMWVATNLSRFVPFPQGAVLAMLYMSIKLHVQLKWEQ